MTNELVQTTLAFSALQRRLFDERLQELIDKLPEGKASIKVSEFAEQFRKLPNDTPIPGPWRNDRTPLWVEPMDCFSADNPTQEVAILKSAQDGATAALCENIIAYTILMNPGPILFSTVNDKMARNWYDMRFIPLINSTGADKVIEFQSKQKRKTKTGATASLTQFPGGFMILASGKNPASFRSNPVMLVILDEFAAYPEILKGEGDVSSLAQARTTVYKFRKKILYLSTPKEHGMCAITSMFLQGDQRYPFLKCPHCNKYIVLEFSPDFAPYHKKMNLLDKEFGLVWKMDGRQLDPTTIGYLCVECHNVIKPYQRADMVKKGAWQPTAVSRDKLFRSYSYSGLYSLLTDWETIIKAWIPAGNNEAKRQAVVNTKFGIAYKATVNKPKFASMHKLRGDYHERDVPHGVLFLTAAVDVQQGSHTNPDYPPRLEMEVCGFGKKYRSWSIEYKQFIGGVDHFDSGAWLELQQYIQNNFIYTRNDGIQFKPVLMGVDARNAKDRFNVFALAGMYDFVYPIMGSKPLKRLQELDNQIGEQNEIDAIDEAQYRDYDPFRISKSNEQTIILVSTNHYKKKTYMSLCVEPELGEQKPYFCQFPIEYDDKYFKMLTAEDINVNGDFILPGGKHNETLDLRVYNWAMHDVYFYQEVVHLRKQLEKQGYSREETKEKVKSPTVLSLLEKGIQVRLSKLRAK